MNRTSEIALYCFIGEAYLCSNVRLDAINNILNPKKIIQIGSKFGWELSRDSLGTVIRYGKRIPWTHQIRNTMKRIKRASFQTNLSGVDTHKYQRGTIYYENFPVQRYFRLKDWGKGISMNCQ